MINFQNEEESLDCDESEQSGVTPKRKRALTHEYYLRSLKDVMSPHSPEDFLNRRKRRVNRILKKFKKI